MKYLFSLVFLFILNSCAFHHTYESAWASGVIPLDCDRKVLSFAPGNMSLTVLSRPMYEYEKLETIFVDLHLTYEDPSRFLIKETRCPKN